MLLMLDIPVGVSLPAFFFMVGWLQVEGFCLEPEGC